MNSCRRFFSLSRSSIFRKILPAAFGGLGTCILLQCDENLSFNNSPFARQFALFPIMTARADAKIKCQNIVIQEDKKHGLFLILHINPTACPQESIRALQNMEAHIDRISPKDIRDEDNEIIAGIAFGPRFLKKVYPDASQNGVEPFVYQERKGKSSLLPATGGDILIHAVCSERGKLFEVAQAVLGDMPDSVVQQVEETYGFVYRNGRDLSGFIDGTENPAEEEERVEVAVSPKTGGSYVLTQRWIHDMKKIAKESEKKMEAHVGRTREDSIEIKPLTVTSHVGRMTYGLSEESAEDKRIVRHSMPYGEVSGECGLFFIAYSRMPATLDWMLDRMTGLSHDKAEDGLFNFTRPVTGAYFYSPSRAELEHIFQTLGGSKRGFWS